MTSGVAELKLNGHSMTGTLLRVLVCSPRTAGWNDESRISKWRELGFHHAPNFAEAQQQHEILCRELLAAGAEILGLNPSPDLSLDAVYAHDASLATDFGLIALRPGKKNREAEGAVHASLCQTAGLPILGSLTEPATAEAGDILWLDEKTLLIGRSYRTNLAGIAQIRTWLQPRGVDVLTVPLPHGQGPSVCLHLMSLISLLDEKTALVDLPWLTVETVEMLESRGFRLIEIHPEERETLACNVLALGNRRLLAIAENHQTNERLRHARFDVRTFPGLELCINGGGGPTCLTRPLLRG